MVQDPKTRAAVPATTLRKDQPKTYEYLREFKPLLLNRGSRAVQAVMAASEFYAMFAVGVETYAPFKVVWRRMGNVFHAAFCSTIDDDFSGTKLVIPSDTVSFVAFEKEDEAFFFLALLNSSPAKAAIYSFSAAGRGLGAPAILKQLNIQAYAKADPSLRRKLSQAAKAITAEHAGDDVSSINTDSFAHLDSLAAEYYRLSASQLSVFVRAVQQQERGNRKKTSE